MFKRFFKEKYESEKTEGRKSKYFKFTRRVQEVRRGNVASGTMPIVPIEPTCCPPLNIEKKLWRVISPRVRHVILGNLGELWVTEEYPNEKYGPNLFGIVEGSEQGQIIIYIFGMVPHEAGDCRYALVAEQEHGEWKLKYKNDKTCSYQWRFVSLSSMNSSDDCHSDDSDRYALQWCGPVRPEDAGSKVVMCLDESDPMYHRICLTDLSESDTPDNIPCEHYLHNFHSIKS